MAAITWRKEGEKAGNSTLVSMQGNVLRVQGDSGRKVARSTIKRKQSTEKVQQGRQATSTKRSLKKSKPHFIRSR
jgi:hypothetical protein